MKLIQLEGVNFKKMLKPVDEIKKLKDEIKSIRESIEKLLKRSPALRKKYGKEFEEWKREANEVESAELKGLDISPAVVIGAGTILTGTVLINKLLTIKKKGLAIKEKILNDPELTFEQKKTLLEIESGKTILDSNSNIVWIFAFVIIFIMILGGFYAFRRTGEKT